MLGLVVKEKANKTDVAFDGLDEDDVTARGFSLEEILPPQGDNDDLLREHMMQKLGTRV